MERREVTDGVVNGEERVARRSGETKLVAVVSGADKKETGSALGDAEVNGIQEFLVQSVVVLERGADLVEELAAGRVDEALYVFENHPSGA